MSTMSKNNVQKLTVHALLIAVICVIAFVPLKTLGLEITLTMVPVAVGATLFGPATGLLLGTVFGVVSFLQCLGFSPFGASLLSIDPFLTFLVCVPTRAAAGLLTGMTASLAKKALTNDRRHTVAYVLGSVVAPILNTVLFMTVLCLCFYQTELVQGFCDTLGATNPVTFILLFVGINGLVEIIAGIVLALPLTKAMSKVVRQA